MRLDGGDCNTERCGNLGNAATSTIANNTRSSLGVNLNALPMTSKADGTSKAALQRLRTNRCRRTRQIPAYSRTPEPKGHTWTDNVAYWITKGVVLTDPGSTPIRR